MRRAIFLLAILTGLALNACSVTKLHQEEELKLDSSVVPDDMANRFLVSNRAAQPAHSLDEKTPTDSPSQESRAAKGTKKARNEKVAKGKKDKSPKAPLTKTEKDKRLEDIKLGQDSRPPRRTKPLPFGPGERTLLSLTYFGVEAGMLDLRVLPYKYIGNRKVVHIRGHGYSTSVFAMVYKVDDVGDSYMDYDGLYAHKLQLKVNESGRKQDLLELYDQRKLDVYYWERLTHNKKGLRITQFTKEIEEYTQDAVTAAFYLRTLPLEVGKEFSYPMVSNGKVWTVTAKVLRREMLTTEKGVFPAFVIQPETRFEGVLSKAGDSYFWISDDEHRSFLKIDAKIKVGKVVAYLKDLEYGKPDP